MSITTSRYHSDRGPGLVLGLLLGGATRSWREPWSRADEVVRLSLYADLTAKAEAAKLHTIFLADGLTTDPNDPQPGLEPVTLLSALAARTDRIGLIGSVSTSFTEPYNVARQIASLDHISGGRAGWNIVTSAWGDENFSNHCPATTSATRSPRSSPRWSSGSGRVGSRTRSSATPIATCSSTPRRCIRSTGCRSTSASAARSSVPATPQGRPILAQAGSSTAGKDFGARHADVVFTTGLVDLAESQEIYADIRRRVVAVGRSADSVKILPGVAPVVGSSDEEAHRIWQESLRRRRHRAGARGAVQAVR